MPLINREINFMLIWSPYCFITNSTRVETFAITDENVDYYWEYKYFKIFFQKKIVTDKNLYFSVITLPTKENTKLLEQLNQDSNKKSIRSTISITISTQA